jgi:hypothetical protein
MAITQAQIDTLEAAIAEGALIVQYQDKKVEYRSLDDMLRTLDWMKKQAGIVGAGDGRRRYASFSKGLTTVAGSGE